jgi:hypothetical protein
MAKSSLSIISFVDSLQVDSLDGGCCNERERQGVGDIKRERDEDVFEDN